MHIFYNMSITLLKHSDHNLYDERRIMRIVSKLIFQTASLLYGVVKAAGFEALPRNMMMPIRDKA
jgi:hypothetical protein